MILPFIKRHRIFLLVFLVISFFYLQHIGTIPYGIFCDEAIISVDAASILKTGRDSNGDMFPLFPRGFGYYDGGLPTYFLIPLIAVFGQTEFAVRLEPVLFLLASVILLYILLRSIPVSRRIGATACALYALQPWVFHTARTNNKTETMSTFFILLGFFFFMRACQKSSVKQAIFAGIALGLSVYGYLSFRIAVPAFVGILMLSEILVLRMQWKKYLPVLVTAVVFFIMYLPFFPLYMQNQEGLRRMREKTTHLKNLSVPQMAGYMLNNYPKYFSPYFLFVNADTRMPGAPVLRHSVDGAGLLFPVLAVLIPLAYIGFFTVPHKRFLLPFLIWLPLYPIPDIITTPNGHPPYTLATFHATVIFPFLAVTAFLFLSRYIAAKHTRYLYHFFIATTVGYFLSFYGIQYLNYPMYSSGYWGWQSGPREIIRYFDTHETEYDEMYLAGWFNAPHVFFPFYSTTGCAKCRIGGINNYRPEARQLFAVSIMSYKNEVTGIPAARITLHETIRYPDGSDGFYLISLSPDYPLSPQ